MIIFDTKADVHLVKEEISCPKISVISGFFLSFGYSYCLYIPEVFFFYYELITDSVFIYHFDTMHFFYGRTCEDIHVIVLIKSTYQKS